MAAECTTQGLTEDHRRCDHLLALVEDAATGSDWQALAAQARALTEAIHAHFRFEEGHLFAPLEARSPFAAGPVSVMRSEHEQIRQLSSQLEDAAGARDSDECRGILETLHPLNVQHNGKEEAVLYPLADRTPGNQAESLLELPHA